MQTSPFSSLLPESLRHKTTRVKLYQPKIILIDFHGTISERRWEDRVIVPYVTKAAKDFLKANWSNESLQRCIPGLRNESFEVSFRHQYEDAPMIQSDTDDTDVIELARQVGDFVLWQIKAKKETKETHLIQQMIWIDGFKRRQIFTPIYGDIMPNVKSWKEKSDCSIYITSSVNESTLKLFLENTDHGDLSQYISGYVSSKKPGDKLMSDTYRLFVARVSNLVAAPQSPNELKYSKLTSSTANASDDNSSSEARDSSDRAENPSEPKRRSPPRNNKALSPLSSRSVSISSQASDTTIKPVLFLTDSGQEAKAASSVKDGTIFECLLVNRPGNKRIRSYYLTRFQYVNSFDDIEFV